MMRSDMSKQIGKPGMGRPGKGPDVTLPVMPVRPGIPPMTRPGMPSGPRKPIRMKKGGMVSTKGNGCCTKTKSCKMS